MAVNNTCTWVLMNGNDGGEHGWLVGEFYASRLGCVQGRRKGFLGAGWETPWALVMREEG